MTQEPNSTRLLRLAAAAYTVMEDGSIISSQGKRLSATPVGRYLTVCAPRTDAHRRRVYVHRLVAYSKFGEAMFAPGIEVRHEDNDRYNNRPDNILIGTAYDNAMDIPEETRKLRSENGRRAMQAKGPEARQAYAANASQAHYATLTPEERNEAAQRASAVFQQRMAEATPEERRETMAKAIEASTKYGPEFRGQVVADYAMGFGCLKISKLRECSSQTVRNILRKEGVTMRKFSPVEHAHQSAQARPDGTKNSHRLAGVSRTRSGGWTSRAKVRGKYQSTGVWPTKEAAHVAYLALKSS